MRKIFFIFTVVFFACANSFAVNTVPQRFTTVTSHDDVYPYVLNNTKTNTKSVSSSKATTAARRAVVSRPQRARATTNTTTPKATTTRRVVQRTNNKARAATNNSNNVRYNTNVSARATTPVRTANAARATVTTTSSYNTTEKISSQRCMSDYKECMENYCKREDTAYNRCYCSAKLSQIDSKYQNKIDELIQKIIKLQYGTSATSDEIKEYWDKTVGVYTGDNPWVNIDNALNIEWADTQSRVRGQNAFNTGHQYCVQHLRGCYYMASNLRDAYKSEIARDCETYEKSLQKIQDAAESVIESYQ